MLLKIKTRLEKELHNYILGLEKAYTLKKISPVLLKYIKNFICRTGKRVRPVLFLIGYLGFSKKRPAGLYKSALSIELLHDFMLVHDDIIDKSDTRRGKPSMHKMFNDYLKKYRGIKFSGEDLTIIAGDVMFAMAIDAFLSIRENKEHKEKALRQLIRATLYTGSGEFVELLYGAQDIAKIKKADIYKIYDYKTAYYTFSSPLAIGAILAGAKQAEVEKLIRYGIYLGRAFQIKDDILGIFSEEKKIGKSVLTDLREAKKTILIWHAYNHAKTKDKITMRRILSKEKAGKKDLAGMRQIITTSGALDYAKDEILKSIEKAQMIIATSKIKAGYKIFLRNYSAQILKL